jgi:16S rRNA (cytosine967-C5)-methyltransferase
LPISSSRRVAFEILQKVETGGGYASDLLLKRTADLDSRDAGLAGEIVFGCLRRQAQLDYLIARHAKGKLDSEVRIALRMGIYQIRYLDRVPRHAAVNESVELIKQSSKRSAAPLVNAVLRKMDRDPVAWPNRATALSKPQWLLDSWDRQFGVETTNKIAEASLEAPETYVAITGRIQDIGAQSIVPLLDLKPGDSFLDLCAAPGNKTAQAIEQGAETIACDLYLHRLQALKDLKCQRVVLDGTHPLPFSCQFDRILVDAPCSGTGTLGHNPEIAWRLKPAALLELQAIQIKLLGNAMAILKPGGVLVYSTCSLEEEENQSVIARVPGKWSIEQRIPGLQAGDGFFAAVLVS